MGGRDHPVERGPAGPGGAESQGRGGGPCGRASGKIEARLAVPAGGRRGRIPGYATQAERHGKQQRLQALRARLAEAERQLDAGRVSVCRGGRDLLRKRNSLAWAGLTAARWRQRWDAARMFLTADGEAGKLLGNETIRWNPGGRWLELKLPAPLSHLANSPHGRYRLSCPVEFTYRGDEVAAQAATGAVRYDIAFDPERGRWYLDGSWRVPPGPAPGLDDLRGHPLLAADLNHDHLAAWIVTPAGNRPARRSPSSSSSPGSRPASGTAGSAPPSPGCSGPHGSTAARRSRSRTSASLTRGSRAANGMATAPPAGNADADTAACWPASRPGSSAARLAQMASNAGLAVIGG